MNKIMRTAFASTALTLAVLAPASPVAAQLDQDPQGSHSPSTLPAEVPQDQASTVDVTTLGLGAVGGAALAGGMTVVLLGLRRRTRPQETQAA